MRTTITLDPDVEALLTQAMRQRGLTFKAAVNEALRRGLTDDVAGEPYAVPTFALGRPRVDLDRATQLAAALEDEDLLRKGQLGK